MASSTEVVGVYEVQDAPDAHLVELVSATPPTAYEIGTVTQEEPGQPRENWQAPWLERFLDPTGERILTEEFGAPPDDVPTTRVVFFLHFLSFDRPLLTADGSVALPSPSALPERLGAIEYEPVD